MTTTELELPGPDPVRGQPRIAFSTRLVRLAENEAARRFAICILGGLVLAIMTGPPGTNAAPTSGFTGSLQFPRLFWFLGLGVVLFAAVSISKASGRRLNSATGRLASSIVRFTAQRRMRLAADVAIVAFGFIWVSWISPGDTWKGGVCIEIGFAFAAMELVVYLFESRPLRIARLGAYAFLALYGVLAWMENPVSKYLNTIGAVPHSRTIGLILLWLVLVLTVLEGLLFGLATLRRLVAPRRDRRLIRLAGVILIVYGWLMWTSWPSWRASSRHSLAHWVASIHVLPHNHTAGLVVMAIGAVVVIYVLVGIATDLVRVLGSSEREHTGQLRVHRHHQAGEIRLREDGDHDRGVARRHPVALAHGPGHPVDPHDPGGDLRAAGHGPQRGGRLRRPARPRLHRFLGDRVLHDRLLHRRVADPTTFPSQPLLDHPVRHHCRHAHRCPDRNPHASSPRRLPGDRDTRLRRDHRDRREQPPRSHRRARRYPGRHPAVLGAPRGQASRRSTTAGRGRCFPTTT